MGSQGSSVPKFYWLARIGPKNGLQTRSKPLSHLRVLDRQKESVEIFVNLRWEATHAQARPQCAKILLACSNRPKKNSADSQQNCQSFARIRSAKKSRISSTLGERQRMRSQCYRAQKFYWLAPIGPKKGLQTRSKPSSHFRA